MLIKTILVVLFFVTDWPSLAIGEGVVSRILVTPRFKLTKIFDPLTNRFKKLKPTNHKLPTLKRMKYFNDFCSASYSKEGLEDLSCSPCKKFRNDIDEHKVFKNRLTKCSAFVTSSKKNREVVVTFRGSSNKMNFLLDAIIVKLRMGGGISVHGGFYVAVKSLSRQVTKYVRKLCRKYKISKIVIAGHSLGGAMARLLLFGYIKSATFPWAKYELYTYGEPRTGNLKFAEYMDRQYITSARIVNGRDIVPHLLLRKTFDYAHCRPEFWIHRGKGKYCSQSVREDPKCSNSLGPFYGPADHTTYFQTDVSM